MRVRCRDGMMLVCPFCCCNHWTTVMTGSARRLKNSCCALDGQGGYHEPKQKCLEETGHFSSLARDIELL